MAGRGFEHSACLLRPRSTGPSEHAVSSYLWVRAFPWALSSFPFDSFEGAEADSAIYGRARELAITWHREHPGAIDRARLERRARAKAKPPSDDVLAWPLISKSEPFFEEVAIVAGWIEHPHDRVVGRSLGEAIHPTRLHYFSSVAHLDVAEDIVDALRLRLPELHEKHGFFGAGHAVLRFGSKSGLDMEQRERVLIEREVEDFQEQDGFVNAWAHHVAKEAKRIRRALRRVSRIRIPTRKSARRKPKSGQRTGRPAEFSPDSDRRIYEAKKTSGVIKWADFVRGRDLTRKEAINAAARHRGRLRSKRGTAPRKKSPPTTK
jgi:hypothetical protein